MRSKILKYLFCKLNAYFLRSQKYREIAIVTNHKRHEGNSDTILAPPALTDSFQQIRSLYQVFNPFGWTVDMLTLPE